MKRGAYRRLEAASPLVWREFTCKARSESHRRTRIRTALWSGLVVFLWLMLSTGLRGTVEGGGLMKLLVLLGMAAGIFMGSSGGAHGIVSERQEGTLGLLMLAPLSSRGMVYGKLASTAVVLIWTLMAMTPLMAISLAMGGVGAGECLGGIGLVLGSTLVAASAGVRGSIRATTTGQAKIRSLSMLAGYLLTGPLAWVWLFWKLRRSDRLSLRERSIRSGPPWLRTGDWLVVVLLAGGMLALLKNPEFAWRLPGLVLPGWVLAKWVFTSGGPETWVAVGHLLGVAGISWMLLETASRELEVLRWNGEADTSGPSEEGLVNRSSVVNLVEGQPLVEGRLLQPADAASAFCWLILVFFSLRAFFVGDAKLDLGGLIGRLSMFEGARIFLIVLYLPIIWQISKGCLTARRSGLWEMIRISPMSDRECLEMMLRNPLRRMALKPLMYLQVPGLVFLVLIQFSGTGSPGWLEPISYTLIGLRTWLGLEVAGWVGLLAGLRGGLLHLAAAKAVVYGHVLPWILSLILTPVVLLPVKIVEGAILRKAIPLVGFGFCFVVVGVLVDLVVLHRARRTALESFRRPME